LLLKVQAIMISILIMLMVLSLVMTTSVNLVILLLMVHSNPYSIHLIHCGMAKDVVVLK
uniref:Uncharacterized protein n=1 Tax=Amphimedon queenslandica TaxID=400682 RepID=A0A1X7UF20_AMPQE